MILTCLAGFLAGGAIGRHISAVPLKSTGSALRPGGPSAPSKTAPSPDFPTLYKNTTTERGKTALFLQALATGRSRNMQQLVDAAREDYHQLSLLADLALTTNPGGFITALAKEFPREDFVGQTAWEFAGRWGKADFASAFQTCRNLPSLTGAWLGGGVLETKFATDPTAALEIAAAHPELRFNWSNTFNIPSTPENLDRIRSLQPSNGKAALVGAISKNLPPDQALALIVEDRFSNPDYGMLKATQGLVEKDPTLAREWILAHPDHPSTPRFAASYGYHLVKTDPAAAVEWATSHLSGPRRTSLLEKSAEALKTKDPVAAEAARALLPSAFKPAGKP